VGFPGRGRSATLGAMWSDTRAAAARRELDVLASGDLPVAALYDAAIDVVASVVPFDAACWGSVDPETNIVTSGVTRNFSPSPAQQAYYAELEASGDEPNALTVLVARRSPAARLTDVGAVRSTSARWNELYRPLGIGFDLRTPLRAGGRVWGVAELFRSPGALDFDDREVAFVSSVADVLGAAARSALLAPEPASEPTDEGPALLVVTRDGTPEAVTPAAEAWIARAVSEGPEGLGMALRGVVGSVAAGHASARARCRIDGRWVALHASPLRTRGADDAIAVSIEPAATSEVSRLLLSAHGLSDRERDVCEEVLAGRSSKEIAARLFISTHTVQDHLKAVFAKVGVSSRRELVASLRPDA
jgi:DNA-binding CsgD family transcriptional regulator/GAF domain-containing protein